MNSKIVCLICGFNQAKAYDDYLDHVLCESGIDCPRCGYYYQYAYGATHVAMPLLGNYYWSWHDDPDDRKAMNRATIAEGIAKRIWPLLALWLMISRAYQLFRHRKR